VLDVMVHIDPEDDLLAKSNAHLPSREVLLEHLEQCLGDALPAGYRAVLHYLDGHVDAELFLEAASIPDGEQTRHLRAKCAEMVADDVYFRAIQLHLTHAQQ